MELKDVLDQLHPSKEFKEWQSSHRACYLAHAFVLLDESNKDSWQIGYYDPGAGTMTTFVVSPKYIEVIPDQEILRSDQEISELKAADVTLGHERALKQAQEYHHLHHPREIPLKTFFILQVVGDKPVYNVTYFFQSMKTLNIKIDMQGQIVSQSLQTLMEFDKG